MPKTRQRRPRTRVAVTERDYVMARLAAARSALTDALTAVDESIELFVNPDEDKSGKDRRDAIETALDAAGAASRALEAADEVAPQVDWKEGEPWDDEDESEDDDSEEEDSEEDDEDDDETDQDQD